MAQFIRLKPVFKETIWGGSALAQRGLTSPATTRAKPGSPVPTPMATARSPQENIRARP